uniref:Signal recognition particle SRP54 subunit M-domain domain-containing protein n=1 Tax=Eucampia antarctica TaxID=49252 RepID=A0A7S2RHR0_9STRA
MISSAQNVGRLVGRRQIMMRTPYHYTGDFTMSLHRSDNVEACLNNNNNKKGGVRFLSTPVAPAENNNNKGFLDRVKDKIDERSQKKQADKYADQIKTMAESEQWDLKSFGEEIDKSVGGWRSKIPGMSNLEQVKAVKENQNLVNALIGELGENATAKELNQLGRKEKLLISLRSSVSVEAINMIVQQFQGMDIMHRILRYRMSNGQPIPTDEIAMQRIMQADGDKVMSKKEKRNMQANKAKSQRGVR